MKFLAVFVLAFLVGLLLGALSSANAEEGLPSWLRLEPGDITQCQNAPGGCTVWTDNDLLAIISITRNREREKCGKII